MTLGSRKKKEGFFVPFILSKGIFFNIGVLSQCIVYWIHFEIIHTFTYQKTLLHTLLLLIFKIVGNLQCILKAGFFPQKSSIYPPKVPKRTYCIFINNIKTLTCVTIGRKPLRRRISNRNKLIYGHLNIGSLRNKFGVLSEQVKASIDTSIMDMSKC